MTGIEYEKLVLILKEEIITYQKQTKGIQYSEEDRKQLDNLIIWLLEHRFSFEDLIFKPKGKKYDH
ncbi:MAG: hypothetical protein EHM45_23955 [Desulfobacteraceae bacterium]|nr:MAG: hypothetical protein EHM45_23955 [Desulfobacteraceae bacterium]